MNEKTANQENNIVNKNKVIVFYEKYKKKIFLFLSIIFLIIVLLLYYASNERKKIEYISENYVTAKVYLANGENEKAKTILRKNIFLNNSTYSTLSLFLMINENLLTDEKEISALFDHLLINCKFKKEIKDLLIFKKILFESNYVEESQLLNSLKPLLNENSLWKSHALLLIGDYYYDKSENIKAREFYLQILNIKNLSQDFYSKVKIQIDQTSYEN